MTDHHEAIFHTILIVDPRNSGNVTLPLTLPKRYSNLKFINSGAQGIVVSADDSVSGKRVAIKKINYPFAQELTAIRAFREFSLLSAIKHRNIIESFSVFTPQNSVDNFQDIYLVMELMDFSLSEVNEKVILDHRTLSFVIYQILCGVHHLHRQSIIHRDLKPSNIAVNQLNCEVKVLDFGLARLFNPMAAEQMSKYVVTRNYRAPEVLVKLPYSEKVDIWSIGCIFSEMITGNILVPGFIRCHWNKIVEILGTPSASFMSQIGEPIGRYVRSLPEVPPKSFEDIIPDRYFAAFTEDKDMHWTASDVRRLISKMLVIDPNDRCSVIEALRDPYVMSWYEEDEVNAPLTTSGYSALVDDTNLKLHELKSLIFDEVKRIESSHDVFGGL